MDAIIITNATPEELAEFQKLRSQQTKPTAQAPAAKPVTKKQPTVVEAKPIRPAFKKGEPLRMKQADGSVHVYSNGQVTVEPAPGQVKPLPKKAEPKVKATTNPQEQALAIVKRLVPPIGRGEDELVVAERLEAWAKSLQASDLSELLYDSEKTDAWKAALARILFAWFGNSLSNSTYGILTGYALLDRRGNIVRTGSLRDGRGAVRAAVQPNLCQVASRLYRIFAVAGKLHPTVMEALLASAA